MKSALSTAMLSSIKTELSGLCSLKSPSLLRQKSVNDLRTLSHLNICQEWCERAPVFVKFLEACVSNPSHEKNKRKTEETKLPAVVSAGATLICQYNKDMTALKYVNGLALKKGGAKKSVFRFLNKMGETVAYDKILGLQDKIAQEALTEVGGLQRPYIVGDNVDMRTHVRHMTSSKFLYIL